MDLMIPGLLRFDGALAASCRGARRLALEDRIRGELWRRCETVRSLTDLPSYRVAFRPAGGSVLCEAELRIDDRLVRAVGSGAGPEEAWEDAMRVANCPATWGESPFASLISSALRRLSSRLQA